MKLKKRSRFVVLIACLGMLMEPAVQAATVAGPAVQDIALQAGGCLVGQVVDGQGIPMAATPLALERAGQEAISAVTDASGRFVVQNLQGGVYQVAAAGQIGVYRFWAPQTAPPAARLGLMMVVASGDLVRGQNCGSGVCGGVGYGAGGRGGLLGWMADHPVVAAGAIGAAIAIPLAVSNDDPPASP